MQAFQGNLEIKEECDISQRSAAVREKRVPKITKADREAIRRFFESPSERSLRLAANAERQALRRNLGRPQLTNGQQTGIDGEKIVRKITNAEREALRRFLETPEERRLRLQANARRQALRRLLETPEEKKRRQVANAIRQASRRHAKKQMAFQSIYVQDIKIEDENTTENLLSADPLQE